MTQLRRYAFPGFAIIACGLLCSACAGMRPGGERDGPASFAFEYRATEEGKNPFGYVGSFSSQLEARPKKRPTAEPVYFSKRPRYVSLVLGGDTDNPCIVAVDESRGTGSGYDTLYFDANGNGDLTDDPKVAGTPETREQDGKTVVDMRRVEFPTVEVAVNHDGTTVPHHLRPYIYAYGTPSLSLRTAGYCEGLLQVGRKSFKAALVDDTCNGRFDDLYAVPDNAYRGGNIWARGDTLVIDVNGDGEYDKGSRDTPEVFHLGKYLALDGCCYDLDVAPDGREVTLAPTAAPLGSIATNQDSYSLELLSETTGTLKVLGGSGKVRVPADEYLMAQCSLSVEDEDGARWRIVGQGRFNQDAVVIKPSKTTSLTLGPPLVAKLSMTKKGAREFSFDLAISGQGGESYTADNFARNGKTPPPPRLRVRDSEGKVVKIGSFEYG
jgi:hypothetical protein